MAKTNTVFFVMNVVMSQLNGLESAQHVMLGILL